MTLSQSKHLEKNAIFYLLAIVAIAFILRTVFLGTIPNGFFCDEASNAYDSYSILKTLKDQHGDFLPFFTRSIDDYRESLYAFVSIPFIKFLGLNEFAARFPSAVIGVLTVVALYYLAKELFDCKTALIASLLLAISPWHIQFSRIAFRAILIPLLFCLALLFFVKSFKRAKYLPVSAVFFAFSLFTYASARVFVPLFMLGLLIIFWEHFWKNRQQTIIALSLFGCIFIPLVIFWLSPEGMSRAKGTGVEVNPVVIAKYYLSYFNPVFLFIKGDPIPRHSAAKIGELYYFELITVVWGLFSITIKKLPASKILLLWLFLYPLPAAMTSPAHALRAIGGVPLFSILSAYGIIKILDIFQGKIQKALLLAGSLIIVASLGILIKTYFIDYPLYTTRAWEYGMREAITYAEKNHYDQVTISNQIYLKKCGSLHTFIPFYTKYDPAEYHNFPISPAKRKKLFLGEAKHTIGKYHIDSLRNLEMSNKRALYIIRPSETEELEKLGYSHKEVHSVKDKRGIEYLKLVEINRV